VDELDPEQLQGVFISSTVQRCPTCCEYATKLTIIGNPAVVTGFPVPTIIKLLLPN